MLHHSFHQRTGIVALVGLLALLQASQALGQPIGPGDMDGRLAPEILLILTDVNGDGRPDIMQMAGPGGSLKVRPGFVARYWDRVNQNVREDGFSDPPTAPGEEVDDGWAFDCYDVHKDTLGLDPTVKTPINHGKITVVYLADSTGRLSDGDDSLLYIGMDIANGDPHEVVGNLELLYADPQDPNSFALNGVPVPYADPNNPTAVRIDYRLNGINVINACTFGFPASYAGFNAYTGHQFLNGFGGFVDFVPCLTDGPDGIAGTDDDGICYFMVPFDTDGDGDPAQPLLRFDLDGDGNPEFGGPVPSMEPDEAQYLRGSGDDGGDDFEPFVQMFEDDEEKYRFSLELCEGTDVLDLQLAMNVGLQDGVVVLLENGIIDANFADYPHYPFEGTTDLQLRELGEALRPDSPTYNAGLTPHTLDVEFLVPQIDTKIDEKLPATPYSVDRFLVAGALLRAFSDSDGDSSGEDRSNVTMLVDIPEIEVAKWVRCVGEKMEGITDGGNGIAETTASGDDEQVAPVGAPVWPGAPIVRPGPNGVLDTTPAGDDTDACSTTDQCNPAWRKTAQALPGSTVEFKIEVENTGNKELDVSLLDEVNKLCDEASLTPVLTPIAIVDGGNGFSNTQALGDDIQVTQFNFPVPPGDGVIILAGPNGVIDSTPGGDDKAVPMIVTKYLGGTNPIPITFFNAGANGIDPVAFFGGPLGNGFLQKIGQEVRLGILQGNDVCNDVLLGDRVVIRFNAVADADPNFCDECQDFGLDVENTITAIADWVDLVGTIREIRDDDKVVDTLRESGQPYITEPGVAGDGLANTAKSGDDIQVIGVGQPAAPGAIIIAPGLNGVLDTTPAGDDVIGLDDNVAAVDELCRGLTFEKVVQVCTDCGDIPGSCSTFADTAAVRPDATFPLCVRYRYTVTNVGEVDEDIVLTDSFLCGDVMPGIREPRSGGNGVADTVKVGDDIQVVPVGEPVEPGAVIIAPGPNGTIETTPAVDELIPQSIIEPTSGGDGIVNTTAQGDDIQVVDPGETVGPGQLIILPGANEVLDTTAVADDVVSRGHPDVSLVDCDVCPKYEGTLGKAGDPNDTAVVYCTVRFESFAGFDAFVRWDDNPTDPWSCPLGDPNTPTIGSEDESCYTNCATVTADAANFGSVCNDAPTIKLADDATVCGVICPLEVTKQLTCIDCETGQPLFAPGSELEVIPGSCVRFVVEIKNAAYRNPDFCKLCKLTISDLLFEQPGQIIYDNELAFFLNNVLCGSTPAGFNVGGAIVEPEGGNGLADTVARGDDQQVIAFGQPANPGDAIVRPGPNGYLETEPAVDDIIDGYPFEWLPGSCGVTTFDANDVLTITFDAYIPAEYIAEPDVGGNGVANTTAAVDDVQVIPFGQPTWPGAVIVLPGANRVLDTVPAGDDVVSSPDTTDPLGVDASNTVTKVCGFVECPGNPACTTIGVPAKVDIDIKQPSVTCTKDWKALWDSDGDCQPGPACEPVDCTSYSDRLDMRDKVFPAIIAVHVEATNDGEVTLDVTASDLILGKCVDGTPDPNPNATLLPFIGEPVGGDGLANTTAQGDDVQLVAVNDPLVAGEAIILPGPNGAIDTPPVADDVLYVTEVVVVEPEGGNGFANTAKVGDDVQVINVGQPAAPGEIIILPGPNGKLDSLLAGDDVRSVNLGTRTLAPLESGEFFAYVRVETAEAMRELATCDGRDPNDIFENEATVTGALAEAGICEGADTTSTCSARILVPPGCAFDLTKRVVCLDACGGNPTGKVLEAIAEPLTLGNGFANTTAVDDDVQVVQVGQPVQPGQVIITPGPDGVLDSVPPGGDDVVIGYLELLPGVASPPGPETCARFRIELENTAYQIYEPLSGGNGIADTLATGDDVQLVPQNDPVEPGQRIIDPGPNGILDTTPAVDDVALGTVKLPRILLRDTLGCDWEDADTVKAWIEADVVTDCVKPVFKFDGSNIWLTFTDANCRPLAPWVAPGETLKIEFDVKIPSDYANGAGPDCDPLTGPNPDCINEVDAAGYTEVCAPSPDESCFIDSDVAALNVLVPDLECEKTVFVDFTNPGYCDPANPSSSPCFIIEPPGGDGFANTTKSGDDIQVIALNQPAKPGDIVIDPGPNGVIDSLAGGDDLLVAMPLRVIAEPVSGGNGIANTAKSGDDIQVIAVGAQVQPGQIIIRPGPNRILDTDPTADDVKAADPLPCDSLPFKLIYRFTAINTGETGLTNIEICDNEMIDDVCTAIGSAAFGLCALCDGDCCSGGNDGCATLAVDLLNCGDRASVVCEVEVANRAEWLALAALDADNNPDCYTNEATVTADVKTTGTDICGSMSLTAGPCEAAVCVRPPCKIDVDKTARCLTYCPDGDPIGEFSDDPRDLVPGSAIEYQIIVTNDYEPGFARTICAVEFTDLLTGPVDAVIASPLPYKVFEAGIIEPKDGSGNGVADSVVLGDDVQLIPQGQPAAPGATIIDPGPDEILDSVPAGDDVIAPIGTPKCQGTTTCFAVDGTPCVVKPSCALKPTWKLVLGFVACIRDTAVGGDTVINQIDVRGAPDCPLAGPVFCSPGDCEATDTITLLISEPSIKCDGKEWSALWDADADCVPGPHSAIVDGGNLVCNTTAAGGDVQVVPLNDPAFAGQVLVLPGADGILDTTPTADDFVAPLGNIDFTSSLDLSDKLFPVLLGLRVKARNDGTIPLEVVVRDPALGACIDGQPDPAADTSFAAVMIREPITGGNGLADTTAAGDDIQVVNVGLPVEPWQVIILPGSNGVLDTAVAGDDVVGGTRVVIVEPETGGNGFANSVKQGDDVQVIPFGDPAPAGAVIIDPGPNGILNTPLGGDDIRSAELGRRTLGPAESAEFYSYVLVETAQAMRDLAACDGGAVIEQFENTASVIGNSACPGEPAKDTCSATITAPPPCSVEVRKRVACVSCSATDVLADTAKLGDDVQWVPVGDSVAPGDAIILPGANGTLETPPAPNSNEEIVPAIAEQLVGGDGVATSVAVGDDVQVVLPGEPVAPGEVVVLPGLNGTVETPTAGGEVVVQIIAEVDDDLLEAVAAPAPDETCAFFVITVQNTSTDVPLPKVCIRDRQLVGGSLQSWFVPGSVNADVLARDGLGPQDVIDCVSPKFDTGLGNGSEQCYWFSSYNGQTACLDPARAWIAPGGRLRISFKVQVPPSAFQDLTNEVRVRAFSEVCADEACTGEVLDEAKIEIVKPSIECEKTIAADFGNDGSIDVGPDSSIALEAAVVDSVALIYEYRVENTGDVPLEPVIAEPLGGGAGTADTTKVGDDIQVVPFGGVVQPGDVIIRPGPNGILDTDPSGNDVVVGTLCDETLVQHAAQALAAIGPCDLCTGACDGLNDKCIRLPRLDPGQFVTYSCKIVFADGDQLQNFYDADGGSASCHVNLGQAEAMPDLSVVCAERPVKVVSPFCEASVCGSIGTTTCLEFEVWDENETLFTGTRRCMFCGWDSRLLSVYVADLGEQGIFADLSTDFGKARIIAPAGCGICPGSVKTPLLGVAMKLVEFNGPVYDMANQNIVGIGQGLPPNEGWFLVYDTKSGAAVPAPMTTLDDAVRAGESGADFATAEETSGEGDRPLLRGSDPPYNRANTAQKGSLIVFPKVEIKWRADGTIVGDTIFHVSNDSGSDVDIRIIYANGEPTECNVLKIMADLTANQASYWSALTGNRGPGGGPIPSFRNMDLAPTADDDPLNPNGFIHEGFALVYVVNNQNQEIRWNHLLGSATIVRYDLNAAWEYNAWAFQNRTRAEGQTLYAPFGRLELDGVEYNYAPDRLVLEFFRPGATLPTDPGLPTVIIRDTELTLMSAIQDLTR